jgi:hypothetical protein
MLLDREILSANIQSCFRSFPDSQDQKFIENARKIHKEFLERFPFDKHPEIIETLKPEDIYQLGNKDFFCIGYNIKWIFLEALVSEAENIDKMCCKTRCV